MSSVKLFVTILVIIGVINTNKNFPITYNFVKFKIKILFKLFFNYLKRFIFVNNIVDTRVILSN